MFHVPERFRITRGQYGSDSSYGNNGAFRINRGRTIFYVIASDGMSWEHVSVHCSSDGKERTPTWAEMCFIKELFWDEEDCAVQYHPAKSEYINQHKFTLHLWRPTNAIVPIPDKIMVGIQKLIL
jgi:hypothetical protein